MNKNNYWFKDLKSNSIQLCSVKLDVFTIIYRIKNKKCRINLCFNIKYDIVID